MGAGSVRLQLARRSLAGDTGACHGFAKRASGAVEVVLGLTVRVKITSKYRKKETMDMIITRLKLKNWRIFLEASIPFSETDLEDN